MVLIQLLIDVLGLSADVIDYALLKFLDFTWVTVTGQQTNQLAIVLKDHV